MPSAGESGEAGCIRNVPAQQSLHRDAVFIMHTMSPWGTNLGLRTNRIQSAQMQRKRSPRPLPPPRTLLASELPPHLTPEVRPFLLRQRTSRRPSTCCPRAEPGLSSQHHAAAAAIPAACVPRDEREGGKGNLQRSQLEATTHAHSWLLGRQTRAATPSGELLDGSQWKATHVQELLICLSATV